MPLQNCVPGAKFSYPVRYTTRMHMWSEVFRAMRAYSELLPPCICWPACYCPLIKGTIRTACFKRRWFVLFFKRLPNTDKALGFDAPALKNSSAGSYFSANSVGHLGFTGTSFWMDLDRFITVIMLTNRIHPSRDNEAIKHFRPILHDEVMVSLLKTPILQR